MSVTNYTNSGLVLVLFILLIIISRSFTRTKTVTNSAVTSYKPQNASNLYSAAPNNSSVMSFYDVPPCAPGCTLICVTVGGETSCSCDCD